MKIDHYISPKGPECSRFLVNQRFYLILLNFYNLNLYSKKQKMDNDVMDTGEGSGGGNMFESLGSLLAGLGVFAVPAVLDLDLGCISWVHEG